MRTIHSLVGTLLLLIALTACGGVSRVPIIEYEGLSGRMMVMTTVSDPHAFAPTTQRSWLESCDVTVTEWNKDPSGSQVATYVYKYSNCQRDGDVQFTTASGYIAGLAGPLLYSGAAVGAAALIGDGLAESGDRSSNSTTTNQTTNTTIKGGLPPRR